MTTLTSAVTYKNNDLYIGKVSPDLEGVFSLTDIKKGDIIEVCPLIIFTAKDAEFLKFTNLYNYYSFKISPSAPGFLPLGFGTIYNHCPNANAEYNLDLQEKTLTISAVCDINAHAQITINYNGDFDDDTPVIFTSKNEIYEFAVTLF